MQPAPQTQYVQVAQPMMVQQPMMVASYPETNAMVALILSIVGIIASFFYGIGLLFSIPGLIMANNAQAITSLYPGHPDAGMANAARIVSIIGIVIGAGFFLLIILAGVFYVWASSLAA